MRLPALCGAVTMDDARQVLKVTAQQQQETMRAMTVIKQRKEILAHPGTLEILSDYQEKDYFELIPGSKNQLKTPVSTCNIYVFENLNGPRLEALQARSSSAEIAKIDHNMREMAH